VSTAGTQFRNAYRTALERHLSERGETTLHAAYELGREAVAAGLGVLDVAVVHHDLLHQSLAAADDPPSLRATAAAAGDFLLEVLATYEMVQRGFREAMEAAAVERRQAKMLRQLSKFLADASLALDAPDSTQEVLQLVSEQARELTGASHCFACLHEPQPLLVASPAQEAGRGAGLLGLSRLLEARSDAVRLAGPQLADALAGADLSAPHVGPHSWLGIAVVSLAGRHTGAIHLLHVEEREFTELDEVTIVHLGQMAAAALERMQLYR